MIAIQKPSIRKFGTFVAVTSTALFLIADNPAGLADAGKKSREKAIPNSPDDFIQKGIASFYGKDFDGGPTASGEEFDMYSMTAAHKTLPFGTWLRVTDRETGREVNVRVNNRGPFVKGRIIDLSYGAAKKLGIIREGVVPVRLEAMKAPGSEEAITSADEKKFPTLSAATTSTDGTEN